MKKICIICEGQTEPEFIKSIISSYFYSKNKSIVFPITLPTSPSTNKAHKGGAMNFDRYKKGIINSLKNKNNTVVSSMIDLYKLDTNFPNYDNSKKVLDKYKRVEFLEKAIKEDIEKEINTHRFLPYIQLHEFESLLFSNLEGFYAIDNIDKQELEEIKNVIKKYNDKPELINDEMPPSKILLKIVRLYDKVRYGTIIAEKIGIETIMSKCPHFKEWVEKLVEMSKT